MAFNINTFYSNLAKTGGVALTSNFEVVVPSIVGKQKQTYLGNSEFIKYRIDRVTVPQRSIAILEYKDYGAPYKIASQGIYVDIDMDVILSPDLRERDYFMRWQDLAIGDARKHGLDADQLRNQFDLRYYDDYVSDGVTIYAYIESQQTPAYEIQLVDAYPLMVGALSTSWASPDVLKMPITFSFRYFRDKITLVNQSRESQISLITKLNQLGLGGLLSTGAGILAGKAGGRATAGVFGAVAAGTVLNNVLNQ